MSTPRRSIQATIFCLIVATAFYCAGQQPPSGGPPDTIPPVIVEMYPESGALQFRDTKLSFTFDKYISRRTFQESFFISPPLGDLSFEWSGKDVEISFTDSLRGNTTYIITIGTDVTDTRNNRLAKAFSLPFSTGNKIDSASIAGVVVDDKPEGVMIFVYQIDSNSTGSLNPAKIKPTYLTQTGKDGSFLLPFLAFGTYRVLAVRDQYKNLLYDPQVDEYGTYTSDVELLEQKPTSLDLQFRLTDEDTVKPFLSSARSLDDTHVLLRLSESMDIQSVSVENIIVVDTLSNNPLKILDVSFTEMTKNEAQIVTERQEIERTFRVMLNGWMDEQGNVIQPEKNSADFNAGLSVDTSMPRIEFKGIKNNAQNVLLDDSIHIVFSEAVHKNPFENGFRLVDSSHSEVRGTFLWRGSAEVFYIPMNLFSPGMSYSLSIPSDSVTDFSWLTCTDSIVSAKFQTVDERLLSGMGGTVSDDLTSAKGRINVLITNVSKKDIQPRLQVLDSPGKFKFDNLLEGKYLLSAFRDADSNGVYTHGTSFPYEPSERFTIYPDTLKLRARWPLENVTVKFK